MPKPWKATEASRQRGAAPVARSMTSYHCRVTSRSPDPGVGSVNTGRRASGSRRGPVAGEALQTVQPGQTGQTGQAGPPDRQTAAPLSEVRTVSPVYTCEGNNGTKLKRIQIMIS